MDAQHRFTQLYPQTFFLTAQDPQGIQTFLSHMDWLEAGESILEVEKPGEGNMNCVLRVKTNVRSFILKQARPWVEKYPQIDAPIERIRVEAQFFEFISPINSLQTYAPKLLASAPSHFLVMMEDLGEGADFLRLYQKTEQLPQKEVEVLVNFLNILHSQISQDQLKAFPDNRGMRQLNHEHIFRFPFMEDNGFDLDPIQEGLQQASMPFKTNAGLKWQIEKLGEVYLGKGDTLLHGDYYPGSWLKVESGIKVIDPEFGFVGPKEFDVAVMIAHVLMAQCGFPTVKWVWNAYNKREELDHVMLSGFVGTEILRRLIGLAQLPVDLNLEEKRVLMRQAANAIQSGKMDAFDA